MEQKSCLQQSDDLGQNPSKSIYVRQKRTTHDCFRISHFTFLFEGIEDTHSTSNLPPPNYQN